MKITLIVEARFDKTPTGTEREKFSAHLDSIAEVLAELDIEDPFIGLDYEEGIVEIQITVSADTDVEAFYSGLSAVRSAIHTAGGHTPGWEQVFHVERVVKLDPVKA